MLDARPLPPGPLVPVSPQLPQGWAEPGPPQVTWRLELVLVVGRVGVDGAHEHIDAEGEDARHDHVEGHVVQADPHCRQRRVRSSGTGRTPTTSRAGTHLLPEHAHPNNPAPSLKILLKDCSLGNLALNPPL